VPEVALLEYSTVTCPTGEKGILYHSVSLPVPPRVPVKPQTIEGLLHYLKNEDVKPLLETIRHAIKSMGRGIEEYATQGYIGYKHSSGRQFAYIRILRTVFELGAHIIDQDKRLLDYEGIRIQTGKEDYSDILEKIKTAFVNLGGKLE